jgi:hypothetical protein
MSTYAVTIFLSAFLLFQVQPLSAKVTLPWFGGGPAVWTTCLLFFQVALLAGYGYAHLLTSRLKPRNQLHLHITLLLLSLAFLPVQPDPGWRTTVDMDPAWRVLALLSATSQTDHLRISRSIAKNRCDRIAKKLNARPRKRYGFETPGERFHAA